MTRALPRLSPAVLFLACATTAPSTETRLPLTPVPQVPPEAQFRATGEVLTHGSSVAFNDWRVMGPHVNLTRRSDGTWAGDVDGTDVLLAPSEGRLSGATADLHFLRREGQLLVRGTIGGRSINIRVQIGDGVRTAGGIMCSLQGYLVDCDPKSSASNPGIELRGAAASVRDPVMPQLGLALAGLR
jgi:hypothetical protein